MGDKPVVASRPGIVQVGGPNDPVIDEDVACARFRTALSSNLTRLNCGQEVQECPELVHPLVELPCVMYSEPSVSQCEAIFDAAEACNDLGPGSCVLTAILDPTDAMGLPLECDERDSTSTDTNSSSAADGGGANSTGEADSTGGVDSTSDVSASQGSTAAATTQHAGEVTFDGGRVETADAALDAGDSSVDANQSSAADAASPAAN